MLAVAGYAMAGPLISSISNAAADSASTGNVARGELISIYGSELATGLGANFTPTSPVLSLGGASVKIGGIAAPITYASPTMLDVQVPFEITAGAASVDVTVTVGGVTSPPIVQNLVPANLGLAYVQVGTQIFNVSAANTAIVTATAGSTVSLVGFGLGSVSPPVTSGIVTPSGTFTALITPPVTMNGRRVPVTSATLANGSVGVYVVTATIPSGVSGPITVVLGGQEAGATIQSIAIDPTTGDVYVANNNADNVSVFDSAGVFKFQFGSTGSGQGQLRNPTGIAIHANGDVYVCNTGNNRIEVFDRDGRYRFEFRH